jgi:hypothetical protein
MIPPMIHGVELVKDSSTFHHTLHSDRAYAIAVDELMQLRSMNVPFNGVLNYRDVSMTDMAVCDTGL